ncbi:MAG: OmpA family protein [Endomicrobia bacterium]|nr:OmpA family protein [Endomicrobiia bacterium]
MKKFLYPLYFVLVCNCGFCTSNFSILEVPLGVRATGSGGNFVSMYDTAEGIFYNPAASVANKNSELIFAHHIYYADTSLQQLSCNAAFKWFGFGILAARFVSPEIKIIDNYYLYDQTFNMSSLIGGVSIGIAPIKNINFGVSGKYVDKKIFKDVYSTNIYDFGCVLRTNDDLFSVSFALQNFPLSNSFNLPIFYNLGARFHFDLPHQATKINIFSAARINYENLNDIIYSFGIEHWGSDVLGIRVGYIIDKNKLSLDIYEQISFFTAGLSIRIGNFGIDYAYLPDSAIGATHNIGINFRFKSKKEYKLKEMPCELKVEPEYFSPNNDGVLDNIFFRHNISSYTKVSCLMYKILDNSNKEMFVFNSSYVPTLADTFYTYDGRDKMGNFLPNGEYFVECEMEDIKDSIITRYKSNKKKFVLDTISPNISIKLSTATISPDGDGVDDYIEFDISFLDELSPARVLDCGIYNTKNQKIYSYKTLISTTNNIKLQWDGKDEIYDTTVPNGEYKILLLVGDEAGNKNLNEQKFRVFVPIKQPQKIVEKENKIFFIKGAKTTVDERGIIVTFQTDDLFVKETDEISQKMYDSLNSLADIIKTAYPNNKISIEGHTDSVGDDLTNKAKSSKYAWKVYSYFVKNCDLNSKLLEVRGWGEEKPVASNKSKLGRAKNRRVEVVISQYY